MTLVAGMLAAPFLLLLAVVAGAQTPAAAPPPLPEEVQVKFSMADTDGSGGLTLDEAIKSGYASKRFAVVDRDNDQIVTLYEIGVYLGDRTATWSKADTNRDGSISQEEAAASPELRSAFSSADRDADGILRQQEYEAWSQTSLYQNTDLPYVVPNIINKTF